MRNFMDLSRALKGLADAFHTIKLKLDGLYDSTGAIGNKFELIETITLEEDTVLIERTTEPDDTPYRFKEVYITFVVAEGTVDTTVNISYNNNNNFGYIGSAIANAQTRFSMFLLTCINGLRIGASRGGKRYQGQNESWTSNNLGIIDTDDITSLKISAATSPGFPTGSVINIYAVRA